MGAYTDLQDTLQFLVYAHLSDEERESFTKKNPDDRIRVHAIGATIGFTKNRTAIALADHPLPVRATTAAELATARLDRDDLKSVLRLIWPSMVELHACFSPVPAPTSGPRRRGVQ